MSPYDDNWNGDLQLDPAGNLRSTTADFRVVVKSRVHEHDVSAAEFSPSPGWKYLELPTELERIVRAPIEPLGGYFERCEMRRRDQHEVTVDVVHIFTSDALVREMRERERTDPLAAIAEAIVRLARVTDQRPRVVQIPQQLYDLIRDRHRRARRRWLRWQRMRRKRRRGYA